MSQSTDNIQLPKIQLDNGEVIEAGWYSTSISNISAVYALSENGIVVKEDGDVSGSSDLDMLSEAPEHYDITTGVFNNSITLENGATLKIENNKLINGTIHV